MGDREQADALVRELVESGWTPSRGVTYMARALGGGLLGPDLLAPPQAAVLAVQAMEAGAMFAYHPEAGLWEAVPAAGSMGSPVLGDLGIVAAKALIALRRP